MAAPAPQDDRHTSMEPAPLIGRDEMNLAEFPITLLADYAPKGEKTLCFQGGNHFALRASMSHVSSPFEPPIRRLPPAPRYAAKPAA